MGKRYGKSIKKQGENSKKQHNLPQITPEFTDKKLTNYGGLLVFAQFLNKLKFCKLVKNCIHVNRGSNSHYMTYDFVSMIVGGILCGAEHMNHVASICKDTVLQKIFDWTGSPAESTFSRFMDLLTWRHQNELVTVIRLPTFADTVLTMESITKLELMRYPTAQDVLSAVSHFNYLPGSALR